MVVGGWWLVGWLVGWLVVLVPGSLIKSVVYKEGTQKGSPRKAATSPKHSCQPHTIHHMYLYMNAWFLWYQCLIFWRAVR